jgi:hypothetical protein
VVRVRVVWFVIPNQPGLDSESAGVGFRIFPEGQPVA